MANALKTTLLLGLLTGLLMWVGQLVGGMQGLVLGLVLAAVMNLGSYWFSDRIVLAAYGARELGEQDAPDLFRIVRELAAGAHMPMPRVYLIPSHSPNAFATGRSPDPAGVAGVGARDDRGRDQPHPALRGARHGAPRDREPAARQLARQLVQHPSPHRGAHPAAARDGVLTRSGGRGHFSWPMTRRSDVGSR